MNLVGKALAAGLVGGACWGVAQALSIMGGAHLHWWLDRGVMPSIFVGDWLSTLLLGALVYGFVGMLATALLVFVGSRFIAASETRDLAPMRIFVGFVVFVSLYWSTKALFAFSWGLPFHHPKRLVVTVLWALVAFAISVSIVGGEKKSSDRRLGWGVVFLVLSVWHLVTRDGLHLGAATPSIGIGLLLAVQLSGMWFSGLAACFPARFALPQGRTLVFFIAIMLLGGGWAYVKEQGVMDFEDRRPPDDRAPNVLMVVVDALRADRLGAYGYRERDGVQPISPHVDQFAEEGVLFETAVCQAPFTWTSFGSFLTGKYPRNHGLLKMLPNQRFDAVSNRTIAQALQDEGYVTGAFMTGSLSNRSGLLEGFDTYVEAMPGHEPVTRVSKWSIVRSEMLLPRVYNKVKQAIDPRLINNEAIAWITRHRERPFFALVHYYSTHTPYDPPAPYAELYDPHYQGVFHRFTKSMGFAVLHRGLPFSEEDLRHVNALYDGGVAFADEMFGALLENLKSLDLDDQTLVIFTSDHGEELFDHEVFEHDWMFNTNLLVPLILRFPGRAYSGTRVSWPVEMIDLPSTILAVTGVGDLPEVDGRSLLPDSQGVAPPLDEYTVVSENDRYIALQDDQHKLIVNHRNATREPRLFDLHDDPQEFQPLGNVKPNLLDEMMARRVAFDLRMPSYEEASQRADLGSVTDPKLKQILDQLGYGLGPNQQLEEDLATSRSSAEREQ
ncbi:MAG: sulfatase-like hydrolase/transferase [Planctomycetota bacterium]|nr:sulfatase-like hydrolase/transferase [Planctomycetota bacterium]